MLRVPTRRAIAAAKRQESVEGDRQILSAYERRYLAITSGANRSNPGFDRRVGREQIARPRHRQRGARTIDADRPCTSERAPTRQTRRALRSDGRLWIHSRRTQQAPAADAEHQFLLQPKLPFAAVQLAGDATMRRGVRRSLVSST